MKLVAETSGPPPRHFEIVSTVLTGRDGQTEAYYLYVYSGETNTHDYVAWSLEGAIEQAREQFGVPGSAWLTIDG